MFTFSSSQALLYVYKKYIVDSYKIVTLPKQCFGEDAEHVHFQNLQYLAIPSMFQPVNSPNKKYLSRGQQTS